jgi:hypothetical protein
LLDRSNLGTHTHTHTHTHERERERQGGCKNNSERKLQKTQINRDIHGIYGLEDSILLRYSSYQNPLKFVYKIDKIILKFVWKCKEPRIHKTILRKKKKTGELTLLEFSTF